MKEVIKGNRISEELQLERCESIKEKIYKFSPLVALIYFPIYSIWFTTLERINVNVNIIYSPLDALIPFWEIFVIPYLMWFGYVAVVMLYFMFMSRRDFVRTGMFLLIGMTICLIIYTVFPNGIDMKPTEFARDNFMVDIVKYIYSIDTPTNVLPSIHCLNSIGIHIGIMKSKKTRKNKVVCTASAILAGSICLSTVFIKQHSILDMFAAIALAIPLYYLSYVFDWNKVLVKLTQRKLTKQYINRKGNPM